MASEVDHQILLDRRLHRQIGRLLTLNASLQASH